MIKKIQIEYIKPNIFEKILPNIKDFSFVTKCVHNPKKNLISIDFEDTFDNCTILYMAIGVPLLIDYISFYSKYKNNKELKDVLIGTIAPEIVYPNILSIELVEYFETNTLLKEKIFFHFNMIGFDNMLEDILDDYEFANIFRKATEEIQQELEKQGVNLKNFSTLQVCFDEDDCFYLKAKNNICFSPENIKDVLKLDIEFEEQEDDFLTIVTFCTLIISILKVKTFLIPKDCEEL